MSSLGPLAGIAAATALAMPTGGMSLAALPAMLGPMAAGGALGGMAGGGLEGLLGGSSGATPPPPPVPPSLMNQMPKTAPPSLTGLVPGQGGKLSHPYV